VPDQVPLYSGYDELPDSFFRCASDVERAAEIEVLA
jgi:hypothetical protein